MTLLNTGLVHIIRSMIAKVGEVGAGDLGCCIIIVPARYAIIQGGELAW